MIFSSSLAAAVAGQSPRKAALTMASLFGAGYTATFTRNGSTVATVSASQLTNNGRDGVWCKGEIVLGVSVQNDGVWKARLEVTSTPTIYAEFDLSADGIDGWIRSSTVIGATLSWSLTVKTKRSIPPNVYPFSLGPNKHGGVAESAIPAIDQAVIGQMQYSRVIKLYDVFDDVANVTKWDAIVGVGVTTDVEVRVNGGAYQSLSGSAVVPIVEGDTVQFRAPAVAPGLNGAGNTREIFLKGPSQAPYPKLTWYFVLANPNTGAPVEYIVGTGQTYTTPEALSAAGVLKAGDIGNLLGEDFPGFKARQSGAPNAPITWRTKPGEARPARILGSLGYAEAFTNPGSQIEHDRYVIWGNNSVSHQKFSNLEISAGRGVASDRTARFAIEQRGHDWVIEDCKIYDSLMGCHSSDYRSGSFTARRNWFDNCGQLSSFNSHSIYLNCDTEAWPENVHLIEHNLITNASAQGIATRATDVIVRSNWIEMNQNVSDTNAETFWTIVNNGGGSYTYSGGPQGSGLAGQFAVNLSGPEKREANILYRQPVNQVYSNVIRASINTGTISVGGDASGFNGYASSYVAHNTIVLPAGRSIYLGVFRATQTPYSACWDNNLVMTESGGAAPLESAWFFSNTDNKFQWPYLLARNNCLPNNSAVYWVQPGALDPPSGETIGRYLHQKGTLWHLGAPTVNNSAGALDVTPAASSVVIGAAAPLVLPGAAAMPAYATPFDLTMRVWATKPTYPLSAPSSGAANTNIGAIA